jgi:hypothetical protein
MNHQRVLDLLRALDVDLGLVIELDQQFCALPGQYGSIAKLVLASAEGLKVGVEELIKLIGHLNPTAGVGPTSPLPTTPNVPATMPGRTDQPTFTPGG